MNRTVSFHNMLGVFLAVSLMFVAGQGCKLQVSGGSSDESEPAADTEDGTVVADVEMDEDGNVVAEVEVEGEGEVSVEASTDDGEENPSGAAAQDDDQAPTGDTQEPAAAADEPPAETGSDADLTQDLLALILEARADTCGADSLTVYAAASASERECIQAAGSAPGFGVCKQSFHDRLDSHDIDYKNVVEVFGAHSNVDELFEQMMARFEWDLLNCSRTQIGLSVQEVWNGRIGAAVMLIEPF